MGDKEFSLLKIIIFILIGNLKFVVSFYFLVMMKFGISVVLFILLAIFYSYFLGHVGKT